MGAHSLNTNQKAIDLLEQNKYDEALKLFEKAVEESRGVQSLTNLAWMYSNEEEDDNKSLVLIEEAVTMNPTSYFPYSLLGEIYMRKKEWKKATDALMNSIKLYPSHEAYNNLGVAYYHLGNIEEAAKYFLQVASNSDFAMYSHIKCLIVLEKTAEAKEKLNAFSEKDEEFVGEIEVADLYVELDCFKYAIDWFEKGWETYWKEPYWIRRYIYSLLKTNNSSRAHEVLNEAIKQKANEINEIKKEECDENWTEIDKEEDIKHLLKEKQGYENQLIDRIQSGHIPKMEFDPSMLRACYLFGCKRHNHQEYSCK
jgi:Tfp pilus assembly protein PilF